MSSIQIDISPSQMRKIKKGLPVRVKKGTGFNLLVHPKTYNIVSRSFNKGVGSQVRLSPEEIAMNNWGSPESHNPVAPPVAPAGAPVASGSGIKTLNAHSKLNESLNEHLGTNYGYLSKAGIGNALSQKHSASLAKMGIDARIKYNPDSTINKSSEHSIKGSGRRDTGIVGKGSAIMASYTPPALVSQPFSANYQFQHFMPPQYQQFSKGV